MSSPSKFGPAGDGSEQSCSGGAAYSPAVTSDPKPVVARGAGSPRGNPRVSLTMIIGSVVAAVLLVTLAAYALLGTFNRYVADDYGGVLAVRLRGFWGAQVALYRSWTGRFTSSALISAAAMLPEGAVRVLPGVLIGGWVLVLWVALQQVVPSAGRVGRLVLAAGVVYTTLQVTPSPFLSIYWMTGSLTYVPSLLLGTLLIALIRWSAGDGRRRMATIAGAGVVAFLAGGSNETYVVAQTVALAMAMAVAISPLSMISRSKLRALGVALLGSLVAAGVLVAAPGNAIRDAAIVRIVGQHPSLVALPGLTTQFAWQFLQSLFSAHWVSLVAVAILAGLVAARSKAITNTQLRSLSIAAVATTIGAVIIVASAILPSVYVEDRLTNAWGQIVLVYVCVCAMATLGWIGGQVCRSLAHRASTPAGSSVAVRQSAPGVMAVALAAFVVVGPIVAVATIVGDVPAIQAWAATKDAEAAAAISAHTAGETAVTVPPLRMVANIGIFSHPTDEDLTKDPRYWINADEAAYYGVASMATSASASP
jgi:hypothetical protein